MFRNFLCVMTIICLHHFLNNVVKIPVTFKCLGVILRLYSMLRKAPCGSFGYRQM